MSFVLVATSIFILVCLLFTKHVESLKGKKDDKKKDNKKKDSSLPVPAEQLPNYTFLKDSIINDGNRLEDVVASIKECGTICNDNPECTGFVRRVNNNDCQLFSKGSVTKFNTPNAYNAYVKNEPTKKQKECPAYEKKEDAFYPAGTIGEPRSNSTLENCKMLCQANSDCNGFMFTKDNTKMCTLKSSFENEETYRGIDTYFKRPCIP